MVQFEKRSSSRRTLERVRKLRFERLVSEALRGLPPHIAATLQNVDVVVEDEPSAGQLADLDEGETLFGYYEGVPQTERAGYNFALPDKITIFLGPLERECDDDAEIAREVQITVLHELAHHFGFDEDQVADLGL
jgi:predicted Zn-dependent protease with MMP-like domain